jgi:hypothetical protein
LKILLSEWSRQGHPILSAKRSLSLSGGYGYHIPLNGKFRYHTGDSADIAIFYDDGVHPDANEDPDLNWQYPLVIGDVKQDLKDKQHNGHEGAFYQLLSYQIPVQRPFLVDEERGISKMLGFLLDYNEGYIIEFTFGKWTDKRPLVCSRITRYTTQFNVESIEAIVGFLACVIDCLSLDDANSITRLIAKPATLFHFPWRSHGSVQCNTHIAAYNHMIVVKGAKILMWKKSLPSTHFFNEPEPHSNFVVKVSSQLLSGGCVEIITLTSLLNVKSTILTPLNEFYVAFFHASGIFNPFFVSITKLICGFRVSDSEFLKKSEQEVKQLFFDDVYQVAMEAVGLYVLHWDIRPENILFDESRKRLIVIDWESVLPITGAGDLVIKQMEHFIGNVHSDKFLKLAENAQSSDILIYSALSLCDYFVKQFPMLNLGVDSFYEAVQQNYDRLENTLSSFNLNFDAFEPTNTADWEVESSSPTISSQSQHSPEQSIWSSFRAELDAIFLNLLKVKLNCIQ